MKFEEKKSNKKQQQINSKRQKKITQPLPPSQQKQQHHTSHHNKTKQSKGKCEMNWELETKRKTNEEEYIWCKCAQNCMHFAPCTLIRRL